MRDMAMIAVEQNNELPARYWKFEKIWVLLGIPAFTSLVWVYWLMVHKPM
jgi:uncharacterized membrane protein